MNFKMGVENRVNRALLINLITTEKKYSLISYGLMLKQYSIMFTNKRLF